jgi:hypothetical protein
MPQQRRLAWAVFVRKMRFLQKRLWIEHKNISRRGSSSRRKGRIGVCMRSLFVTVWGITSTVFICSDLEALVLICVLEA